MCLLTTKSFTLKKSNVNECGKKFTVNRVLLTTSALTLENGIRMREMWKGFT